MAIRAVAARFALRIPQERKLLTDLTAQSAGSPPLPSSTSVDRRRRWAERAGRAIDTLILWFLVGSGSLLLLAVGALRDSA